MDIFYSTVLYFDYFLQLVTFATLRRSKIKVPIFISRNPYTNIASPVMLSERIELTATDKSKKIHE